MIKPQRSIHRLTWLFVTPLLVAGIIYFSQPNTELSPPNAPGAINITETQSDTTTRPKGALP